MIGLIKMRDSVWISPHALDQWQERVSPYANPAAIARWVRSRLRAQMGVGLRKNRQGRWPLKLTWGLVAIMDMNSFRSGWVVVTFIVTVPQEQLRLPG